MPVNFVAAATPVANKLPSVLFRTTSPRPLFASYSVVEVLEGRRERPKQAKAAFSRRAQHRVIGSQGGRFAGISGVCNHW